MFLLLLYCLVALIAIVIVVLVSSQKRQVSSIITENENNTLYYARPKSPSEIEEEFFQMKVDYFLKKKYPILLSWAFEENHPCHALKPFNRIHLIFKDGIEKGINLCTKDVFEGKSEPAKIVLGKKETETKEKNKTKGEENRNSPKPEQENIPTVTPEQQWIIDNAVAIENDINALIKCGCGTVAYYEVKENVDIEKIVKILNETTVYTVSHKDKSLVLEFE